jgi:imidazolonepropionase-like amidohydrolase
MTKLRITFLFLLSSAWSLADAQVLLNNYAITGVSIIDANHRLPLSHQTVLISNKTISAIFNDGSQAIPDTFSILKMEGRYLLPGLIDTHVHMATDPSGIDNREHTVEVLKKMLYSGVTSVRDMAGDARTLAGLSRDAFTGDIISPDIYYSALMAGPVFFSDPRTATSTNGATSGRMPYMLAVSDTTNLVLAVAQAKGTMATGIKLYANVSPDLVKKISAEANRQGIIVWSHAWLQHAKPSDLITANVSSISHASLIVREKFEVIPATWKEPNHNNKFWDSVTPDLSSLWKQMKEHHTILDATLLTYKQLGEEVPSMQYHYEVAKRITSQAYMAGVVIVTGTDDDQKEFVQKEMELMVKEVGMRPIDAIIAATLNGAKALHIDNKKGLIRAGQAADILLLDKNPLEDIENIRSVYLVIKNGKIYKQ